LYSYTSVSCHNFLLLTSALIVVCNSMFVPTVCEMFLTGVPMFNELCESLAITSERLW
jgi:hypothetical protein